MQKVCYLLFCIHLIVYLTKDKCILYIYIWKLVYRPCIAVVLRLLHRVINSAVNNLWSTILLMSICITSFYAFTYLWKYMRVLVWLGAACYIWMSIYINLLMWKLKALNFVYKVGHRVCKQIFESNFWILQWLRNIHIWTWFVGQETYPKSIVYKHWTVIQIGM